MPVFSQIITKLQNKPEVRTYGVSVQHTCKQFEHRFIDYSGSVMYDSPGGGKPQLVISVQMFGNLW